MTNPFLNLLSRGFAHLGTKEMDDAEDYEEKNNIFPQCLCFFPCSPELA